MKVMERVGQLKWNEDGVPAEEEEEEEEEGSGLVGMQGERMFLFVLNL